MQIFNNFTQIIIPMFDFIKKLFSQKEKIGLLFVNLENWFNKKTAFFYEDVKNKIEKIKENLENEIAKTKENIKKLENTELKNKDISVKEKQFMEGNMSFYAKRVNIFIDSIKISDDVTEIMRINNEIEALGKSTFKAYQILQNFFGDETYAVSQNIKKIEDYFKELKSLLENKKIKESDEIKALIKSLKNDIMKEKEERIRVKTVKNKIMSFVAEKKNMIMQISRKEQSNEFKEYHKLKVDEYKANEEINELKQVIVSYFSALERALKKHSKLSPEDEELVNKYMLDPLDTLIRDIDFKILEILEKVKEGVISGSIDLKDKKKEKTLQIIGEIDSAKLTSFLDENSELNQKLNDLDEKTSKYTLIDEIEDEKVRLKGKEKEIENENEKIKGIKNNISNMDIGSIKKDLNKKIDELLDIELNIDY